MKRYIALIICMLLAAGTTFSYEVRKSRRGIIVIDNDTLTRAMEPYGGSKDDGADYADVVNMFKHYYDKATIYCMIIPNAVGIYCPEEAKSWTSDEAEAIRTFYNHLSPQVSSINIIDTLRNHRDEDIYLRTDHHWAPLGAYYAARTFAAVAGVPFSDLDDYEPMVVRNFVGTMYKFTRESCIARHPEDFIYYKPKNVDYNTTQIKYRYRTVRRKKRRRTRILTATAPQQTDFFRYYADGSMAAYSTFMGGDLNTTIVRTSTANKRRLLIMKDSYGNALPPFLFGSFEEIHVVDCRYFIGNVIQYAKDNSITDVLFANNLIHASTPVTSQAYKRYMTPSK